MFILDLSYVNTTKRSTLQGLVHKIEKTQYMPQRDEMKHLKIEKRQNTIY